VSFFARMARQFLRPHYLRSFRRELLDFLRDKERTSETEVEAFLSSMRVWEERISPERAATMFSEKIDLMKHDPRVADLYFQLSNAYYLAGDFFKYQSSFVRGLEELKNLRRNNALDLLGAKFLFTQDWGWVIGHISHLDQLVKLRELGLLSPHERIMVLSPGDGANQHYLRYWKRHIRTLEVTRHEAHQLRSVMRPLSEQLSGFELKSGFSMFYEAWNLAEVHWQKEKRPPLLELEPADAARGWEALARLGMSPNDWFVGLHVREYDRHAPNHVSLRAAPNSDIQSYLPAVKSITDRGGWVIRMGDSSMSGLPPMDRVIDYANSDLKSDWMDVFLWASCRFFIGTSSGPLTVPATFGVPVLYTNSCGLGFCAALGRSLVMPKLFKSRAENRLLRFSEVLERPIGWSNRIPEDSDVELRDNSPDEIEAATDEMFALLAGGDGAFDRRSALQEQFGACRAKYGNYATTPIAHSFVSKHRELL